MKLPYSRPGQLASCVFQQSQAPCHRPFSTVSSFTSSSGLTRAPDLQIHSPTHRQKKYPRRIHRTVSTTSNSISTASLKKPEPSTPPQNRNPNGNDNHHHHHHNNITDSQQENADKTPATLSLSDQVRLLMRRVPYPVTIITATDPHVGVDNHRAFRGMTVSSFNTVSLNPEPVVSFNVKRPSETLTAILTSGRFLVHLLAPNDATAALARGFSRGNHNLSILNGDSLFEFASYHSFDDGDGGGDSSPSSLPILRRSNSSSSKWQTTGDNTEVIDPFPFVFECRLNPQRVEIYDHTIVLGTVVGTLKGGQQQHDDPHQTRGGGGIDPNSNSNAGEDLCLTYANTRFWKMGREI